MRIFSTRHNQGAFNLAMLILRLGVGILIINHGYQKIIHFSAMENSFINFMGIGSKISLSLVIFAEFFCGILIAIGLFTRLACIPILFSMGVAFFKVKQGDAFGHGEVDVLYIVAFLAIFLAGPGTISGDSLLSRR